MAVLTARAREFLFALEIGDTHEISQQFRLCGERNGLKGWGRGPVLYGSIKEWVCTSRKSERKAQNFGYLLEDDGQGGRRRPSGAEGGYIFVGDTGEMDELAGEIMISRYPERMKAVFLHVVSDAPRQGRVMLPMDRVLSGVPVVYFRTYVGAAAKAFELGLMDKSGVDNVITAAKEVSVVRHGLIPCVVIEFCSVNRTRCDRKNSRFRSQRLHIFHFSSSGAARDVSWAQNAGGRAGWLEIQHSCRACSRCTRVEGPSRRSLIIPNIWSTSLFVRTVACVQAMAKIPPKSSKWVDINRDLLSARTALERQSLPSVGVETLTLTNSGTLAPKTKSKLEGSGSTRTASRRQPSPVATATKTRP